MSRLKAYLDVPVTYAEPSIEEYIQLSLENYVHESEAIENAINTAIALEGLVQGFEAQEEHTDVSLESFGERVELVLSTAGIDVPMTGMVPSLEEANTSSDSRLTKLKETIRNIIEWIKKKIKELIAKGKEIVDKFNVAGRKATDRLNKAIDHAQLMAKKTFVGKAISVTVPGSIPSDRRFTDGFNTTVKVGVVSYEDTIDGFDEIARRISHISRNQTEDAIRRVREETYNLNKALNEIKFYDKHEIDMVVGPLRLQQILPAFIRLQNTVGVKKIKTVYHGLIFTSKVGEIEKQIGLKEREMERSPEKTSRELEDLKAKSVLATAGVVAEGALLSDYLRFLSTLIKLLEDLTPGKA